MMSRWMNKLKCKWKENKQKYIRLIALLEVLALASPAICYVIGQLFFGAE